MSDLPTIAFAGIGLMGLPMCRRLLAAGYRLVVWNRSSAKCQPLVDLGARAVATPAELCAEADVVLLCLADTAAVREVLFGKGGVAEGGKAGKLLVDHSSLEPTATRDMAAELEFAVACAGSMHRSPAAPRVPRRARWRSWPAAVPRMSSGCGRF